MYCLQGHLSDSRSQEDRLPHRKNRPQIFDKLRWIFSFRKDNKRYKTCCHCSKNNCCDGNDCCVVVIVISLCLHRFLADFAFRGKTDDDKCHRRNNEVTASETRRQIAEQIQPTSAAVILRLFPLIQNMTTNSAVMTNSIPVVSKWITYPSSAPAVAAATQ